MCVCVIYVCTHTHIYGIVLITHRTIFHVSSGMYILKRILLMKAKITCVNTLLLIYSIISP